VADPISSVVFQFFLKHWHVSMLGIPGCETCARLEAQEERLRSAYGGTVRSLEQFGGDRMSVAYEATKNLAEHMWDRLEAAGREFEEHRRTHLAGGEIVIP
jgi:hypothetical protein